MNAIDYIRMVLWSFLGIRKGTAAGREAVAARPLVLLVTAVGLAAAFVLVLLLVATLATHKPS
jgi:hypothetical protein